MSYSVLLADDEPLTLSYLKGIIPRLEPEFSEILCAQNGREALELLKKRPADLVITDIRMPETDGLTLIRELREQKLCTKIVILSGYDEFSYAQQAIRCGVQDYLLKPIEKQKIADLLHTVKAELDRVRLAAEEQRTMQNSVSAYQLNAAAEQLNALASLHADAAALRKTTLPDLPLFARQNVVLAFGYDAMSLAHKCASVQDLDLYDYVLYQLLRDMAREHTPEQVWFFGRERYMLLCGSAENAPAAARRIGQQLTDLLQRTAALHLYVAYSPVFSAAEDFPLCAARAEQNLCRGWSISLAEKWENRVNDLALQNVLLDCAEAQNGSRLKTLLNSYLSGIESTPAVQAFAALHLLYPRSELLLRHPVPDENSFAATRAALALVHGARPDDTVLFLVSGGGSALFEQPRIPDSELFDLTRQMLACGASITEMNTIRKRLSMVKGGRFAQACAPAHIVSILLSDILGDPLDMIASGPAVPDPSTSAQAFAIVEKYRLALSPQALRLLAEETPKELTHVETLITGSVRELCRAGADACRELGYTPCLLTDQLDCEAREAGRFLAAIARSHRDCDRPLAFLAGGETIVRLTGKGKGGRNQELALAAAEGIAGLPGAAIFSVGSDGTDGPTDAAGGYADGDTQARLTAQGIHIAAVLQDNDAYHALAASGGLIVTGPTGTNVNDLSVLLLRPEH